MFSRNDIRQIFTSTLSERPAAADMNTVRRFCVELMSDVPQRQREAMLARLETMRRASDLWHLRTALFGVIARQHGEQVAKARLAELDTKLLPYSSKSPR